MKAVIQLDEHGYFLGVTTANESPLEPGIFHMPANTIDTSVPTFKDGQRARWDGKWVLEDIPVEPEPAPIVLTYAQKRAREYPPMADYLDGIVKGDKSQIDKYIADCKAVKLKYPKPM